METDKKEIGNWEEREGNHGGTEERVSDGINRINKINRIGL